MKRLLVLAIAPYVVWLVFRYEYHFLDGVNLAFHEAGHLFLGFGGKTLHFLGGTIAQLFFPAACLFHFLARRQPIEAAICGIWLGESLMYAARYVADARDQVLPPIVMYLVPIGAIVASCVLILLGIQPKAPDFLVAYGEKFAEGLRGIFRRRRPATQVASGST